MDRKVKPKENKTKECKYEKKMPIKLERERG